MKYTYKKRLQDQPVVKKQIIAKKTMGTILYHVSLEPVTHFIPRVPENRAPGEDCIQKRICLSTSIESCINAMPGSGASLLCLQRLGINPVLFVYRVQVHRNTDYLVYPHQIKQAVCDAEETEEHWLLKTPPMISKFTIQLEFFETKKVIDPYGNEVILIRNMQYRHMKHNDVSENAAALLNYFAAVPEKERLLRGLIQKYGIRTVLITMHSGLKEMKS